MAGDARLDAGGGGEEAGIIPTIKKFTFCFWDGQRPGYVYLLDTVPFFGAVPFDSQTGAVWLSQAA